jgi:anionic cell wall polymer biosynthesis LytR-Cps2A-Psr (LCP) family protein
MRSVHFDKSSIFLILIIVVLLGVGLGALLHFRTDAVGEALKNDRIIKAMFVLENEGKPLSTNVLFFYPESRKAAVFDIPDDTGLILKSLGRVDRIGAVFKRQDPKPYFSEVEKLLGTDIPMRFVLSVKELGEMADLLDGLELFIPNPVMMGDQDVPALFPQGTYFFDGDKVKSYVLYENPEETESDLIQRKQKCFLAFIKRICDRTEYLKNDAVLSAFMSKLQTNLGRSSVKSLVSLLSTLDAERIVPSRVQGTKKAVEGKTLLFPMYNGDLLKDIVKQNLNALVAAAEVGEGDRVFTLEILNGTNVKGLAKKAADLYESFGYEILTVKNAEEDTNEKTVIYDHLNNPRVAANIAAVIKSTKEEAFTADEQDAEATVDFTILLGKDFNGRYCIP